ncbi:MAG TPA: hypothetical protein PK752_22220 [Accumulibacter sp.]|nr:hypothetical protein [Accumulibacter sp.]HRD90946.1 hypothetical protein [Accumulibacter sp.]
MLKALADVGDHGFDLVPSSMGKSEQQAGLTGVLSQASDPGEQHQTT